MTTWINCNLSSQVKHENIYSRNVTQRGTSLLLPSHGGSLFAVPGPVKYSWQGPFVTLGRERMHLASARSGLSGSTSPALAWQTARLEKNSSCQACFSCAVVCTAPMVMLLNGPLAIVATVSCSTRIPTICLHLMKLVPWESEQLGFTLGTSLSTHRCFQVKTALHPLQKAGSCGFEFTPPLMDSSCTSVRTSTCGTDLRYIH